MEVAGGVVGTGGVAVGGGGEPVAAVVFIIHSVSVHLRLNCLIDNNDDVG